MPLDIEIQAGKFTRFEKARLLGSRALQISMGAPFLVKMTPKMLEDAHYNPVEIAKLEFAEGLMPIVIKRTLPHQRR
jgi:DNA-directed RNA polymerase subunit K